MAKRMTAKAVLQSKNRTGGEDQVTLTFVPDYADGRNKEWAKYTPALSVAMTVKGEVAEDWDAGQSVTITFEQEETN